MNREEIPVVRNIFIAIMLTTFVAGYDIARQNEKLEVKAQEVQVVVSGPTSTPQATTTPQATPKYIRPTTCQSAIEEVFGDQKYSAEKVSFCESSFNPQARHTNSSAKGCFQIIDGTWKLFGCTGDPLDALDNTRCAKKIYDHAEAWNTSGGWKASYWCHEQI